MDKIKVVILNDNKISFDLKVGYEIHADQVISHWDTKPEEVLDRVKGCKVVVSKEFPLPKSIIEHMSTSVELICEAGTGYNNIDLDACNKKGIKVCNVPAYSTNCVAQTAMMMILNLASSMRKQIKMIDEKDYSNFTDCLQVPHFELNGKVLGIIGAGNIGKALAKLANAFGMKVLAYTRTPKENTELITYTTLEEVLRQSDFISLHCPLTPNTHHIISEKELNMMKNSAFIINTARGALIDEKALIHALNNKTIAGAGLDVQEVEPLPIDNPLYHMDNVIVTPHMGWKGFETRKRLCDVVADNIHHFLEGNPINIVNED